MSVSGRPADFDFRLLDELELDVERADDLAGSLDWRWGEGRVGLACCETVTVAFSFLGRDLDRFLLDRDFRERDFRARDLRDRDRDRDRRLRDRDFDRAFRVLEADRRLRDRDFDRAFLERDRRFRDRDFDRDLFRDLDRAFRSGGDAGRTGEARGADSMCSLAAGLGAGGGGFGNEAPAAAAAAHAAAFAATLAAVAAAAAVFVGGAAGGPCCIIPGIMPSCAMLDIILKC